MHLLLNLSEKKSVVKHSQIIYEVYARILESIVYKPAVFSIKEIYSSSSLNWLNKYTTIKFQWDFCFLCFKYFASNFIYVFGYILGIEPRALSLIGKFYTSKPAFL